MGPGLKILAPRSARARLAVQRISIKSCVVSLQFLVVFLLAAGALARPSWPKPHSRLPQATHKSLSELCAAPKHNHEVWYANPLVLQQFICHGYIETICRKMSFSCLSAIPKYGFAKVEPDRQRPIVITFGGRAYTATQTLSCRCARGSADRKISVH